MTTETVDTNFALRVVAPPRWVASDEPPESAGDPAVLLTITDSGQVSAYSGKVEYGQAIRHGFALNVADQLGLEPGDIDIVLADTARVPWDRATVGSASTRTTGVQLGRAAIAAANALRELAATKMGVAADSIEISGGSLSSTETGQTLTIADALRGEYLTLDIPDSVPPPPEYTDGQDAGRAVRIDALEKVTGRAVYAQDFSLPGMLHGRIVRPPSYGAKLQAFDTARAERVDGFVSVVREGDFLGVVAETEHAAERAADAVRVRWSEVADEASDWTLPVLLKEQAGESVVLQEIGSPSVKPAAGALFDEATYYAPYVANAQMEPSASVASWEDGKLTVWCGNRGPFMERALLADELGLDEDFVRVISLTVGGSFGTKSPTVSIEAARLAMSVGRPVKVTYSRSDEFQWSTVRPAALIDISSAVTPDGKLTSWEYRAYYAGENAFRGRRGAPTPYDVPNVKVAVSGSVSPLQYGSYRSLGGATNHFAREVHMDRVARRLELDPGEFRLMNLSHPRYIRVLKQAMQSFGWEGRTRESGTGYGLAVGFDAGSYVAQCVEVRVEGRQVNVVRVTSAFDCGAIFNPDGVRNQVEGSIVMGLGTALWESVEFDNGRVLNNAFSKYRVPRIMDTPVIDVVLIDDPSNPATGAGEPGIVTIAAAIANAVRDATGTEIDQIPVEPQLR